MNLKKEHYLYIYKSFIILRTNSIIAEEANTTVYLKISRSNGLNTSVSVEWETRPDSAFGISKSIHGL